MISHILLSPPAIEPVTLEEIKVHAKIEHDVDDTLIGSLLCAARQWCEHYTRRAFIHQTWDLALSTVPQKRYITLPRAPLAAITHVQLFDDADNLSAWDAQNYFTDMCSNPGKLVLRNGSCWPSPQRCAGGMVVTYVAGYGDSGMDVPEPIKLAIKQLALHWYEYRGDSVHETMAAKAPLTIEVLLDPYRVLSIGGQSS